MLLSCTSKKPIKHFCTSKNAEYNGSQVNQEPWLVHAIPINNENHVFTVNFLDLPVSRVQISVNYAESFWIDRDFRYLQSRALLLF
jgi:hypothetical protein